jgi:hypothetical protein
MKKITAVFILANRAARGKPRRTTEEVPQAHVLKNDVLNGKRKAKLHEDEKEAQATAVSSSLRPGRRDKDT